MNKQSVEKLKLNGSLFTAAHRGETEKCRRLIAEGADVNDVLRLDRSIHHHGRERVGKTVLHIAACYGKQETCQFLVESGCNPYAKDNEGRVPLNDAFRGTSLERREICLYLLGLWKSISEELGGGLTVLHVAADVGDRALIEALVQNGAKNVIESRDDCYPLHCAASAGNAETCAALIEAFGYSRHRNRYGNEPLHEAVVAGCIETIQVILDSGNDIHRKNSFGETALHLAARGGNAWLFDRLLSLGMDPGLKDDAGKTCLDDLDENKDEIIAIHERYGLTKIINGMAGLQEVPESSASDFRF